MNDYVNLYDIWDTAGNGMEIDGILREIEEIKIDAAVRSSGVDIVFVKDGKSLQKARTTTRTAEGEISDTLRESFSTWLNEQAKRRFISNLMSRRDAIVAQIHEASRPADPGTTALVIAEVVEEAS